MSDTNANNLSKREMIIEVLDIVRRAFAAQVKADETYKVGYISESFHNYALGEIEELIIRYLGATDELESDFIGEQLFEATSKADVAIIVDSYLQRKGKPTPKLVK